MKTIRPDFPFAYKTEALGVNEVDLVIDRLFAPFCAAEDFVLAPKPTGQWIHTLASNIFSSVFQLSPIYRLQPSKRPGVSSSIVAGIIYGAKGERL